ncbi:MAG: hypothetical protein JWQ29_1307, partial [Phenylobacterium sp.]|nr:hypothetical protein [Phenylobacterium sp.]
MRTTFDAARARSGPGSLALLGESWAILRAQPAPVLGGLLLANVAFAGAAQGASAWAAEALKAPPAHWAFEVAKAAVMALITAVSLRLFLAPRSRWERLDRSLARGV